MKKKIARTKIECARLIFDVAQMRPGLRREKYGNRNRRIKTQELLLSLVQATRYCSCSLNLRSCARIRSSNHHILVTFASPSPRHTLGHRTQVQTRDSHTADPHNPSARCTAAGSCISHSPQRKRICAARDLFKPLAPRNPAALPPPAWHQGLQIGRTCRQRGGRRRR